MRFSKITYIEGYRISDSWILSLSTLARLTFLNFLRSNFTYRRDRYPTFRSTGMYHLSFAMLMLLKVHASTEIWSLNRRRKLSMLSSEKSKKLSIAIPSKVKEI